MVFWRIEEVWNNERKGKRRKKKKTKRKTIFFY